MYLQVRLSSNNKREWPTWIESTTHVAHSLMSLNSSVNFYVYCVKHFRDSCCPPKNNSSNNGGTNHFISTTSGDHLMVNRPINGTITKNFNSETVNETIVWEILSKLLLSNYLCYVLTYICIKWKWFKSFQVRYSPKKNSKICL